MDFGMTAKASLSGYFMFMEITSELGMDIYHVYKGCERSAATPDFPPLSGARGLAPMRSYYTDSRYNEYAIIIIHGIMKMQIFLHLFYGRHSRRII